MTLLLLVLAYAVGAALTWPLITRLVAWLDLGPDDALIARVTGTLIWPATLLLMLVLLVTGLHDD